MKMRSLRQRMGADLARQPRCLPCRQRRGQPNQSRLGPPGAHSARRKGCCHQCEPAQAPTAVGVRGIEFLSYLAAVKRPHGADGS